MNNEDYPPVNLDYKADLAIDQFQLELEWLAIAGQIMAYSEAFAQAIFDRNRAKENLDVARAEVDSVVRKSAADAQEKVTEAMVTGRIQTSGLYREAQEALIKTEYVVDVLRGAVAAFQAKKTALENLVRLFGMKYYAEPYEPPGSGVREAGRDRAKHEALGTLKGAMEQGPEVEAGAEPLYAPDQSHWPLKGTVDGNTPKPSVILGPPAGKIPAPDRDKDGHRYAIGPISEHGRHTFTVGPFSELQHMLDQTGLPGQAIYKLSKEKPDEIIYVWDMKLNGSAGWVEEPKIGSNPVPKPAQPPSPTPRPLPRRPGK